MSTDDGTARPTWQNIDFVAELPFRQEPPPTLQSLPVELIWAILEYVDVKSVRNFRLSCKQLAHDSRPELVRHIMFTETPKSFARLLEICQDSDEIANAVRSLTYIPFIFHLCEGGVSKLEWDKKTNKALQHHLTYPPRIPPNSIAPFEEFDLLVKDRSRMAEHEANVDLLCKALSYIKPHSIEICSDSDRRRIDVDIRGKHAHFIDVYRRMPFYMRRLHKLDTSSHFQHRNLRNTYKPVDTRSFMAVLYALDRNSSALNDYLALKASTGYLFLMSPFIENFGRAVSKLRKLDLAMLAHLCENNATGLTLSHNWDSVNEDPLDIDLHNFWDGRTKAGTWTLGQFLSRAESLEELRLYLGDDREWVSDVRVIPLIGFVLPQLRSLTLDQVIISGEDLLLPIIAHAKTLRRLEIKNAILKQTVNDRMAWPNFFKLFRRKVREGVVTLDELSLQGVFTRNWGHHRDELASMDGEHLDGTGQDYSPGKDLGRRLERFVLGEYTKCLWTPRTPPHRRSLYSNRHLPDLLIADDMEDA